MRFFKTLMIVLPVVGAGCLAPSNKPQGHYEGTLLRKTSAGIEQSSVAMDVTYDRSGAGIIAVTSSGATAAQSSGFSVTVTELGSGELKILAPGTLDQATDLSPSTTDAGCYAVGPSGPNILDKSADRAIEFCFDAERIYLEISNSDAQPVFTLSGNRFARTTPIAMESPAPITLPDAVDLALKKNFESRIEFERLIESKDAAKAAWLSLIPHLSLSGVLSNLPVSATGLLGAIADLAPFAIPSNWFRIKQAELQTQAERDALLLMQADLATEIEQLTYALKRDEGVLDFYSDLLPQIVVLHDRVENLEKQRKFPEGSTLHLNAIVNSMQLDMLGLRLMITEDKTAVAQALGFNNPDAITEIDVGTELTPIETATQLETDGIETIALARSFELEQMDALIAIAKSQSKATLFNWLTPSSDPSEALGAAIGKQFAVSKDQVEELSIQREESQQGIFQRVSAAVDEYNEGISGYELVLKAKTIQKTRWDFEMQQVFPGSQVNTLDFLDVIGDAISIEVQRQTTITGFRVARSKIDRLLLQGYYLSLQKNLSL